MKKLYLLIVILIITTMTGCSDTIHLGAFTDSTYVHYTPDNIMDIFRENITIDIDDLELSEDEKIYLDTRDEDITIANYRYFGYSTEYIVDNVAYNVWANEYVVNTI